jgi:hypothetical protein
VLLQILSICRRFTEQQDNSPRRHNGVSSVHGSGGSRIHRSTGLISNLLSPHLSHTRPEARSIDAMVPGRVNFDEQNVQQLTGTLQSWYDLWPHSGRFLWKTAELHEQYGPIIRIGPNEVQIKDPDFYGEMYTSGSRRREKSLLFFWSNSWTPFPSKLGGLPG